MIYQDIEIVGDSSRKLRFVKNDDSTFTIQKLLVGRGIAVEESFEVAADQVELLRQFLN